MPVQWMIHAGAAPLALVQYAGELQRDRARTKRIDEFRRFLAAHGGVPPQGRHSNGRKIQ